MFHTHRHSASTKTALHLYHWTGVVTTTTSCLLWSFNLGGASHECKDDLKTPPERRLKKRSLSISKKSTLEARNQPWINPVWSQSCLMAINPFNVPQHQSDHTPPHILREGRCWYSKMDRWTIFDCQHLAECIFLSFTPSPPAWQNTSINSRSRQSRLLAFFFFVFFVKRCFSRFSIFGIKCVQNTASIRPLLSTHQ